MREYPLQYASTDKNKKSHYNNEDANATFLFNYDCYLYFHKKVVFAKYDFRALNGKSQKQIRHLNE